MSSLQVDNLAHPAHSVKSLHVVQLHKFLEFCSWEV